MTIQSKTLRSIALIGILGSLAVATSASADTHLAVPYLGSDAVLFQPSEADLKAVGAPPAGDRAGAASAVVSKEQAARSRSEPRTENRYLAVPFLGDDAILFQSK